MELLLPITLVLVGLALVAAEVYLVPGVNILGLLGLAMVLFAVVQAFLGTGPMAGLLLLGGVVVTGGALMLIIWRTGAWDRFVLSGSLAISETLRQQETEDRGRLMGKTGRALTPLRPTGVIEVDDTRVEATTQGEFISAGSHIRVVAIDRRHYFVRLEETPAVREG